MNILDSGERTSEVPQTPGLAARLGRVAAGEDVVRVGVVTASINGIEHAEGGSLWPGASLR